MLSLYVHWPYCVTKCPYCDFFSVIDQPQENDVFKKAYLRDLQNWSKYLGHRSLKTIFFGGGTPSLMDPSLVEFIIQSANNFFPFKDTIEITLEANPGSSDLQKFKDLKKAGISRLSLGIQSFEENHLKFLGRGHSVKEAISSIEAGLSVFDHLSFDLIYALPGQTIEQWEKELVYALDFNTKHLSLYQLVIEPGTQFYHRFERHEFDLPESDVSADFYDLTTSLTMANQLQAYEVSNYAKPGFECQHNLTYWRYEDYIGIGPGAHSRVTLNTQKHAHAYPKNIEKWLSQTQIDLQSIPEKDEIEERILMGLRLKEGIPRFYFQNVNQKNLDLLLKEEILIEDHHAIRLSDLKRHQAVLRYLFA